MTDEPAQDTQPAETAPTEAPPDDNPPDETRGEAAARRRLRFAWAAKVTRPIVGWVLLAVGVLALIAGYWGVANEALVAKQLPYLVSGGIGGMVLVAVGAFILGTHDVRQQLTRVEELEQLVRELHDTLLVTDAETGGDGAAGRAAKRAARTTTASASPNGAAEGVVALGRGHSYHRPTCSMVAGKDVDVVDRAAIRRRDLAPCSVCEPELATAAGRERPAR